MATEVDVVIIGAGAAGLSAAKELNRVGLTYVLLEGSHRIGGRAYSEEIAPGEWFDLGCAWLVDSASNPFTAIAEDLNIELSRDKSDQFKNANLRFVRNGTRLSETKRAACLRYYGDSYAAIAGAAEKGRDVPISDVVEAGDAFSPPFLGGIATSWGLDIDQVSTTDFSSTAGELGFQALRGYGNLVAAWGADVPVSLNTRAERIDWSGGDVKVETPRGTVTGRTLLSTVSTGILGAGDIVFTPELPDWKSEAIHNLPMGTENKMGVHFDTDVFGADGRGFYSTWNDEGNAAKVDASVMGLSTAAVFVGGRHGIWLEKQGAEACRDFAVDRVADIFGSAVRKHVDRTIVTAWNSEPWTRGSWACAAPGHADQRAVLARPVDDRLFFAGEATLYGGQGTCDGAFRSGLRAAREIAATLGVEPQVTSHPNL